MATDQQFCLRWNNHQSTLISVFDSLLENGTLVDCTLAAEGQSLKAHKVVLSACSPYLEALLSQHYEKHPIVILKDVKFSELKSMMDYMYRGEVNISQDQLGTFLKAAESLQIKGLSDNGDDARDVGSTNKKPDAPRPNVTQTRAPLESKRPAPLGDVSDTSRDGSISPSSLRKRRRTRRPSNGEDPENNLDNNVCDLPAAQSTPMPVPSAPVQSLPKQIVKTEPPPPMPDPVKKEILDPPAEPLLEPKTEYLDYMNNENSIEVEDLTLDDDDEDGMDSSMDASRPGPSHGDLSQGGYPPWTMTGDQSGTDEIFMAAQEAVGAASGQQQRDSQGTPQCADQVTADSATQPSSVDEKEESKSKTGCEDDVNNELEPTKQIIKIRSDLFEENHQPLPESSTTADPSANTTMKCDLPIVQNHIKLNVMKPSEVDSKSTENSEINLKIVQNPQKIVHLLKMNVKGGDKIGLIQDKNDVKILVNNGMDSKSTESSNTSIAVPTNTVQVNPSLVELVEPKCIQSVGKDQQNAVCKKKILPSKNKIGIVTPGIFKLNLQGEKMPKINQPAKGGVPDAKSDTTKRRTSDSPIPIDPSPMLSQCQLNQMKLNRTKQYQDSLAGMSFYDERPNEITAIKKQNTFCPHLYKINNFGIGKRCKQCRPPKYQTKNVINDSPYVTGVQPNNPKQICKSYKTNTSKTNMKYKCETCYQYFRNQNLVTEHNKIYHSDTSLFTE